MLRTLRSPRYAALGALMVVVALVCVGCGVWQVFRFETKRDDNSHLRRNAEIAAAPVSHVLPVLGAGRAPSEEAIEFRQVRATGRYDAAAGVLVRSRTDGDDTGFLVLTPLRTAGATLLVVRGFLPQPSSGAIPTAPAPPTGTVTVTARANPPETRNDHAGDLTHRQVQSINPVQQQQRLGGTVFDGYATLEAGQPGGGGLRALPRPDLSNPAGGALEPQHFAYVIQWFLFAGLALAAPFAMARAEARRGDDDDTDIDTGPDTAPRAAPRSASPSAPRSRRATIAAQLAGDDPLDDPLDDPGDDPLDDPVQAVGEDDRRAAKLADRYGRPVR